MITKHFVETSNKVKLQINRVRINRAQPVTWIQKLAVQHYTLEV